MQLVTSNAIQACACAQADACTAAEAYGEKRRLDKGCDCQLVRLVQDQQVLLADDASRQVESTSPDMSSDIHALLQTYDPFHQNTNTHRNGGLYNLLRQVQKQCSKRPASAQAQTLTTLVPVVR